MISLQSFVINTLIESFQDNLTAYFPAYFRETKLQRRVCFFTFHIFEGDKVIA